MDPLPDVLIISIRSNGTYVITMEYTNDANFDRFTK